MLSIVQDIIIHKTQIPQSRTSKPGRAKNIHIQITRQNRKSVGCFKKNDKKECEWNDISKGRAILAEVTLGCYHARPAFE